MIHSFESYSNKKALIVVDVQKSFKKFFTDRYISALKEHCAKFDKVYQVYDNHYMGKNPGKQYLYSVLTSPDQSDLFDISNVNDKIEKRYTHSVNIDFFRNLMDRETLMEAKKSKIGIGDSFPTKYGTRIYFIGNKHRWFHCPKKLEKILLGLKNMPVEIVGGSDKECLDDIFVTAESLGIKITKDYQYIWTAKKCPI